MKKEKFQSIPKVKKFYFLEYFWILIKSIEKKSYIEDVFELFKERKHEFRLGESKYRKITQNRNNLTKTQEDRYFYTFRQVIDESIEYGLIKRDENELFLTKLAYELINTNENSGTMEFNKKLLFYMERKFNAFRYIIDLLYDLNRSNSGLFIFPIYSPRKLGIEKKEIKNTSDIIHYSKKLVETLQDDIERYLQDSINLSHANDILIKNLITSGLLSNDNRDPFDASQYNRITKRFRDYWLKYFLTKIYHYEFSLPSFELWIYRGKQVGIIHATEFYPSFNGRIVFPTSVILDKVFSDDFECIYEYEDGNKLFMHKPILENENNENIFIDKLVESYFELKKTNRSYFINLAAIRELVCFKMKISETVFGTFLNSVYKKNLLGELTKINISLEVDRLPEETRATYIKREPVIVDGKPRNIIAIEFRV